MPAQRSVYRNKLYDALPDNLDSPCGASMAHCKHESLTTPPPLSAEDATDFRAAVSQSQAMVMRSQPFAEEMPELMACQPEHVQAVTPFGSPAILGESSSPATLLSAVPAATEVAESSAERLHPYAHDIAELMGGEAVHDQAASLKEQSDSATLPSAMRLSAKTVGSNRERLHLFAHEVTGLMGTEAMHDAHLLGQSGLGEDEAMQDQAATPFGNPAILVEQSGSVSMPSELPSAAEVAEDISEWPVPESPAVAAGSAFWRAAADAAAPDAPASGQRGTSAEQPDHAADREQQAEPAESQHTKQELPSGATADGTGIAQHAVHAYASGSGGLLEAFDEMQQEEPQPLAHDAVQGVTSASISASHEHAECAVEDQPMLHVAASGDGSILEGLDEVEQEELQLIAAYWPPGIQPDQATSLPGLGSAMPR